MPRIQADLLIPTPLVGINGLKHQDFETINNPIPDSNASCRYKWIETDNARTYRGRFDVFQRLL